MLNYQQIHTALTTLFLKLGSFFKQIIFNDMRTDKILSGKRQNINLKCT